MPPLVPYACRESSDISKRGKWRTARVRLEENKQENEDSDKRTNNDTASEHDSLSCHKYPMVAQSLYEVTGPYQGKAFQHVAAG